MNEQEILEKVQEIFRDVFDDDELVVTPESNADTIEGWDSLSHIRLVVAIEKAFGIKLSFKDLQALKNVGDMNKIIQQKISAK